MSEVFCMVAQFISFENRSSSAFESYLHICHPSSSNLLQKTQFGLYVSMAYKHYI